MVAVEDNELIEEVVTAETTVRFARLAFLVCGLNTTQRSPSDV